MILVPITGHTTITRDRWHKARLQLEGHRGAEDAEDVGRAALLPVLNIVQEAVALLRDPVHSAAACRATNVRDRTAAYVVLLSNSLMSRAQRYRLRGVCTLC